jgi:lipopolysaccharide export system permease protein
MIPVIDRYLIREVIQNWLAVTLVLWAMVVANRLARYLSEAAAGDFPGAVVFSLLGLKSINYLVTLTPFALFLGVLLTLGRWYRDNEMTVLAACGAGPLRLYRPLLAMAFLVGLILALASLLIAPFTARTAYELQARAESDTELGRVVAGRFIEARRGRLVFYAQGVSASSGRLEKVFVQSLADGQPTVITAQHAYLQSNPLSGERLLVLEDGMRYQGSPGEPDFRVMRFVQHGLRISETVPDAPESKRDALATEQLWPSADNRARAELQWRLSLPLSVVVLVFLALPLSQVSPREGRYARLLVAVLIYLIYFNLLRTAQVWLEHDQLPTALGLWWVHLIPLCLGLLMFRLQRLAPSNPLSKRRWS